MSLPESARTLIRASAAASLLVTATPVGAVKIQLDETRSLDIGLLLQPQFAAAEAGAADGESWSNDFHFRRVRILVSGNLTDRISFFVDTDQPNLGRDGNWDASFFVQDAFLSYRFAPELTIDGGMILVPLTRHSMQGATTLGAVDYHADMIRYPAGSTRVWRDVGAQARGGLFEDRITYRLAVFNGLDSQPATLDPETGEVTRPALNETDVPRFAGHVRFNILGRDNPLFYRGIHFTTEPLLSVGFGADHQSDALVVDGKVVGYTAWAGDVFLDLPIGADMEAVAQFAVIGWDQGENQLNTGTALLGEAGFRWRWIEPVVGWEAFRSDADDGDVSIVRGGLNFWIEKHAFNVKGELASVDRESADERQTVGTIQAQLLF